MGNGLLPSISKPRHVEDRNPVSAHTWSQGFQTARSTGKCGHPISSSSGGWYSSRNRHDNTEGLAKWSQAYGEVNVRLPRLTRSPARSPTKSSKIVENDDPESI